MANQILVEAKAYIVKIISIAGGLTTNEIYERLYIKLKDHTLVKGFLINQGYTCNQIARAKHANKHLEEESWLWFLKFKRFYNI